MKKWRSVIIFDVAMIILAIILFSPAYVGLSPFSPQISNMVLSIVAGAIIIYETIKVNGRAFLTARAAKQISSGETSVPVEDVRRVLGEYEKTTVVGTYAKHALAELDSAAVKRESLYNEIGKKFQEGSLTFMKFAEVVDAAVNAIAHNSSILARRIQAFDVEDYNRVARGTITGLFNRSTIPDDLRKEKRQVYEMSLNDMRGIVAANERLLMELDRFGNEMRQLETSANAEKNTALLEEVNTLVEETKYYQ